jgi:general stress protein 26
MFNDTIREFLQKPLVARMATIDSNGYPHIIPVWFDVEGDDLMIISERKTRKIDHIRVNPKGSVNIGGDTNDGAGYLFKGEYSIEEDPGHAWMKKMTYRYESGEKAEKDIQDWLLLDMIVLRFKIEKTIKVL